MIYQSLNAYLAIAIGLFAFGLFGVLQRRSLIGVLIAIELILNAAALNFMAFNRFLGPEPVVGQVYALFIMGIAAAEAAIALSIVVAFYRQLRTINIERADELKG